MSEVTASDFTRRHSRALLAPPQPERAARPRTVHMALPSVRRRLLLRRAVVAIVSASLLTLVLSDVRGRMDVGHIDHAQGMASTKLAQLARSLSSTDEHNIHQHDDVLGLDVQMLEHGQMIQSTEQLAQVQQIGIFYDALDLSTLNTCLNGVTQALDQIGVGQSVGASNSLIAVGPTCQSASP